MTDIEDLVHLEQDFFDAGYKDGYAHGRIHGLIEGRALGREKGYEIWEEVGFYEGFALVWKEAHDRALLNSDASGKGASQGFSLSPTSLSHIRHLLQLISQFPKVNPKSTSGGSDRNNDPMIHSDPTSESEVDILGLLSNIRARYKALSASLGVRARIAGSLGIGANKEANGEIFGKEQPKKTKPTIWKIEVGEGVDESVRPGSGARVGIGSKLDEMSF